MSKLVRCRLKSRVKCRACGDIIKSKHRHDYVTCSCGEVSVDGGEDYTHINFKNRENLMLIDGDGNEIIPKYKDMEKSADTKDCLEASDTKEEIQLPKPKRDELLAVLDEMVKNINELPQHAMFSPITHADFASLLLLLSSIFRSD